MSKAPTFEGEAAWTAAFKAFVEARAVDWLGYPATPHEFISDFATSEGQRADDVVFALEYDLAAELRTVAEWKGLRLDSAE